MRKNFNFEFWKNSFFFFSNSSSHQEGSTKSSSLPANSQAQSSHCTILPFFTSQVSTRQPTDAPSYPHQNHCGVRHSVWHSLALAGQHSGSAVQIRCPHTADVQKPVLFRVHRSFCCFGSWQLEKRLGSCPPHRMVGCATGSSVYHYTVLLYVQHHKHRCCDNFGASLQFPSLL